MPTPLGSIACFLAAALLGAPGQYLYKAGADQAAGGVVSYLLKLRGPSAWQSHGLIAAALLIVALGGVLTACRRLARIAANLKRSTP